jgi:hypothetical protein
MLKIPFDNRSGKGTSDSYHPSGIASLSENLNSEDFAVFCTCKLLIFKGSKIIQVAALHFFDRLSCSGKMIKAAKEFSFALQISGQKFYRLNSFRFCYTSPGVASRNGDFTPYVILLYPMQRPPIDYCQAPNHFFMHLMRLFSLQPGSINLLAWRPRLSPETTDSKYSNQLLRIHFLSFRERVVWISLRFGNKKHFRLPLFYDANRNWDHKLSINPITEFYSAHS